MLTKRIIGYIDLGLALTILVAVLATTTCCSQANSEPTTVTRTANKNKSKPPRGKITVPIEEGLKLNKPPGQQKKLRPSERPDFVFAYNADTAEPIRVFAARDQQAMLQGVAFNKVDCADLETANWGADEIDVPVTPKDSVLVKTSHGIYVIGRGKLKQHRLEAHWRKLECP